VVHKNKERDYDMRSRCEPIQGEERMIGKDSHLDISVIRYEWGVATSKRDIRIEVCWCVLKER